MVTHAYALLGRLDAEACIALGKAAVREWEAGWCPFSGIEVTCAEASATAFARDGQWLAHRLAGNAALWSHQTADFSRQIERLVFKLDNVARNTSGRHESDIAENVAVEAAGDLAATLTRYLTPTPVASEVPAEEPPAWQWRRSAGAALIKITSAGKSLSILLPHALLPAREKSGPVKEHTPLTGLTAALTDTKARLVAELGEVEVSLGLLTSLTEGDVLTLPVSLDAPLKVYAGNRCLIGQAHLGQLDGHRALEIVAVTPK